MLPIFVVETGPSYKAPPPPQPAFHSQYQSSPPPSGPATAYSNVYPPQPGYYMPSGNQVYAGSNVGAYPPGSSGAGYPPQQGYGGQPGFYIPNQGYPNQASYQPAVYPPVGSQSSPPVSQNRPGVSAGAAPTSVQAQKPSQTSLAPPAAAQQSANTGLGRQPSKLKRFDSVMKPSQAAQGKVGQLESRPVLFYGMVF